MAQPTPYDRQYNFASYQALHPSDPLPGDQVDAELNAVKASLDETQSNLALIQRDDGQLANGSVGIDQLAPEITIGLTRAIMWAPNIALAENQSVFYNLVLYRTLADCNTGPVFNAAQFVELADLTSIAAPGGTINTAQLADGCITTPKLADGAVTPTKMGGFAASKLIGRYSGTDGDLQTITVTGGLALSGSGDLTVAPTIPGPLGIGMTPVGTLDMLNSVNGEAFARISNPNAGASANAKYYASNGTHTAAYGVLGANFTQDGVLVANCGFISASFGFAVQSAGAILFGSGGTAERGRFGTDGSFLVGSSTNAGAGAIAATGNITAFYSDERLKTRIGPVDNAVAKIMALSAFYYHANDLAREASGGVYDPAVREVGLSAQEVEAVLPEVVAPAPFNPEYKTLRYERIVTLCIAAIQEQQAQIEALRAEIAAK